MVVIEDENEIVWDSGDLVEQGGQDRFGWQRLRGLQEALHPGSQVGLDGLQSGDEVS